MCVCVHQFTRGITVNWLKFGTNVPLHELGKCAKLFYTMPPCSILEWV